MQEIRCTKIYSDFNSWTYFPIVFPNTYVFSTPLEKIPIAPHKLNDPKTVKRSEWEKGFFLKSFFLKLQNYLHFYVFRTKPAPTLTNCNLFFCTWNIQYRIGFKSNGYNGYR